MKRVIAPNRRKVRSVSADRFLAAAIEPLERRVLLSSIVVNSISDDTSPPGVMTLREAVMMADSSSSPTTITFDPTVFATPQTIVLNGDEMEFSNEVAPTTITGPAAALTISGNMNSRIFEIQTAVTVNITGLTLTDGNGTTVFGNSGGGGGAILNGGGYLTLSDSTLTGNSDDDHGGAIYAGGAGVKTTLNDVTISNNMCSGEDGGIANYGGTMVLSDSTVSDNQSAMFGGGIENDAAMTLVNDTIANNVAHGADGGGIENFGAPGVLTLTNVTIAGNTCESFAGDGGGGIANDNGGTVNLANCIIAGNFATGGATGNDVLRAFHSLGHNLIGDTANQPGFVASDLVGTTDVPLDAHLAALADNGGPTLTMLPLVGSPAIDAGFDSLIPIGLTTDQRGQERIVSAAVDIGATEVQLPPAKLAFPATLPSANAGAVLNPAVIVDVEDANGNTVVIDGSSVTLAIATGPAGATLGGTTTAVARHGVATFTDLTFSTAGPYTLTAGDGALTSATSLSFTITPRPSSQVAFGVVPPTALAGVVVNPAITVNVEDTTGAIVTADASTVTLAIATGPAGATLGGTTTVAALNGVAAFNNVTFSEAGTYTLAAGDGALLAATSAAITVTPPSQLKPTLGRVSLPASVVAGSKFKGKLAVIVTNTGAALKGNVTFNFYADTATGLDGNQMLMAAVAKHISLKAGKARSFAFSVVPSASLPVGIYHVLAEVVDPSSLINVAATTQTSQVAAAFVQPAILVGVVTPGSIAVGKTGSVVVIVTNNGNVASTGIDMTLSPSSDGSTPLAGVVLGTQSGGVKIQPGKSKKFKLRFKVTAAVPAGTYRPYVSCSLNGVTATLGGTVSFVIE